MSQNPNGGPPNYNPYGPNPSNPNYPAPPGTAYGGSQPPSGPNPGYNPYPPSNPPSGPDPNTPNSSYGPYSNPYAPPPPSTGPNPYGNPPTPMPPSTGPNPYGDPYAPTVMSQSQQSSPAYPSYNPQPLMDTTPPPMAPGMQPQRRGRGGVIIAVVIALVVIIGGSIFGVVAYNNNQATIHANATATALANAHAQATSTAVTQANISATATSIASNYPFSNNLVLSDPLVDNSKGVNWDNKQSIGCFFSGSAYHVTENKSGFYNTCAALNTNYSDFTFESEMVIKQGGNGAAGGFIFRADENGSKYYRLSIDNTGSYFILVIVDTTGTGGNARILKQGTASSFTTGFDQTNTLGIVARGSQYSFYVNGQPVTSFTDGTYSHGQIGFDVDYGTSATDVAFTNAKVWKL